MNENLDLTKILEGCPEGTEFYSVIYGECSLVEIFDKLCYPICLKAYSDKTKLENRFDVTKDGRYLHYHNGECTLFPSKDQRDWSKFVRFWDKPKVDRFDVNTLQPFDKVLVRDYSANKWGADFFLTQREERDYVYCILNSAWKYCIPYNEATKHLIGTTEDCPEYYKWWEE